MEQVFVVRRADFFGGAWPQGFTPFAGAEGAAWLDALRRAGWFVERPAAENEPAWKQLIPYCVLRRAGTVLAVQRRAAQTEDRLHGRWSIGLGGHVNPAPAAGGPAPDGARQFAAALRQELEEELYHAVGSGLEPRFCGLVNDDASAVGRVHAGLVYVLDCPAGGSLPEPRIREISKMHGAFRSLAEMSDLWQDPARFESWSRILIQAGLAGTGLANAGLLDTTAVTEAPGVAASGDPTV